MQVCFVFSESLVNVLSYFRDLEKKNTSTKIRCLVKIPSKKQSDSFHMMYAEVQK